MNTSLEKAVSLMGGQTALARAIGVKQGHVWKWLNGSRFPAEYCIAVERATDGRVTRYELRPDIYPVETA